MRRGAASRILRICLHTIRYSQALDFLYWYNYKFVAIREREKRGGGLRWLWDAKKNRLNKLRHGLSFETAQLVFDDPLAASRPDPYSGEERWQTIGVIGSVVGSSFTHGRKSAQPPIRRPAASSAPERRPAMKDGIMKRTISKRLKAAQRAELEALAALPDDKIDTKDIPEVRDWSGAQRGLFFRPIKQQLTLRVDADIIAWFRSTAVKGEGYQTRINRALREYVDSHTR